MLCGRFGLGRVSGLRPQAEHAYSDEIYCWFLLSLEVFEICRCLRGI